jgi:regulatory protein
MLAIRELSEKQVRQRLATRGHDSASIDEAVARLVADKSIDDARVAGAIARTEATVRKRGRLRVLRQIEAAGIDPAVAARAVEETFEELDDQALLAAALDKRLRGKTRIADDREFGRLYRYLMAQGFEPDRILALLRKHRSG